MSLALNHARILFLETVRVPIALVFNVAFPAVLLLFFVLPNEAISGDPGAATAATIQLTVFAVMNACLLNFGVGVAEERSRSWEPFLRSLPVGAMSRMSGRIMNGMAFVVMAVIPVLIIAPLLTEATASPGRLILGFLVVLLCSLPFLFGGLAIGYSMPMKAALPVAQGIMFPMAFVGGLFLPPEMLPGWVDSASIALPTRAVRDMVLWAVTGQDVSFWAAPSFIGWTVLTAALAVWAYRRDEGKRYT
ncbi:ABC transporter permease [Nocardiopsis sp. NPDC055879]